MTRVAFVTPRGSFEGVSQVRGDGLLRPGDDSTAVARFLMRSAALHIYEIGDLSEPYRSSTRYFFSTSAAGWIDGVVMIYEASEPPTLIALASGPEEHAAVLGLLRRMMPSLPDTLYTHLSPGLEEAFGLFGRRESRGHHLKYVFAREGALIGQKTGGAARLGPENADEVRAFLDAAYPGHFFHPRVLEDRMAFGLRDEGVMKAFAGVHVLAYSVAALGNVATAPEVRGQGYARRCITALIGALSETSHRTIGLNVEADNTAALTLYTKLGFDRVAAYDEAIYTRRAR